MRPDLNYTNDELAARHAASKKSNEERWEEIRIEYHTNPKWNQEPFINFLLAFYEPPLKKKNQYPYAEVDKHLRNNQLGTL